MPRFLKAKNPRQTMVLRLPKLLLAMACLTASMTALSADHGSNVSDKKSSSGEVDVVTSASVDATTGASIQLEPVKLSDKFSVAYAVNDNGALFIMAGDLSDAYQRDELASDSIFKGKNVVAKGKVAKSSPPGAAKPWLTLIGSGNSEKKVRCALKAGQLSAKTIEEGSIVQIKGVCDGMKMNVSIIDGEIIE